MKSEIKEERKVELKGAMDNDANIKMESHCATYNHAPQVIKKEAGSFGKHETKCEVKHEVKHEAKQEAKPELEHETKLEVKHEVKQEMENLMKNEVKNELMNGRNWAVAN